MLVSPDIKTPADAIFRNGKLPDEPLIYVCCPTKTDPSLAPPGKEAVYILSLVPNLSGSPRWPADLPAWRKKVFERLRQYGADIREDDIELEEVFTPENFRDRYGSQLGSAFGLAPDFFQSAAFRPTIRSKDIRGLYHVGMSTHPGGGLPMVLTCGRLAAEEIQRDAPVAA